MSRKVKRVRIPGGNWISRVIPESSPEAIKNSAPAERWQTQGCIVLVRDMETRHLLNAIKLIEAKAQNEILRHGLKDITKETVAKTVLKDVYPQYPLMIAERDKRLKQIAAMTHDRQEDIPARAFNFD